MAERTVEQMTEWKPINDAIERCRDILDPTVINDWENCPAQCSADLALIARYFVNSPDLAQIRKDAERWRKVEASHRKHGTLVVSVADRGGYVLVDRDQLADFVDAMAGRGE